MSSSGPIFLPKGFIFSAIAAGIKSSKKPDLALIVAESCATAAALFLPTWQRLRRNEGARELERRLPGQDGRIDTILDAQRRARAGEPTSPLTELLAGELFRAANVPASLTLAASTP